MSEEARRSEAYNMACRKIYWRAGAGQEVRETGTGREEIGERASANLGWMRMPLC